MPTQYDNYLLDSADDHMEELAIHDEVTCWNCGQETPDKKYCDYCGANLRDPSLYRLSHME